MREYSERQTQERSPNGPQSLDASSGATSFGQEAARTLEDVKNKAVEMKEKVLEAGRKTVDKVDAQREPSARAIENTAQGLRKSAQTVSNATTRAARATADKLQDTADYIRENDVEAMVEDVKDEVRKSPVWALAIALVAGFLVGKAVGRNWG